MEEERLQQQIGEQKRVQAEFLETEHPHVEDVKRLGQEMLVHCYTPHGGGESENVRALRPRARPHSGEHCVRRLERDVHDAFRSGAHDP